MTTAAGSSPQHFQDPGRNLGLDLLRAIAILLVLISHWANNIGFWFHVKAPNRLFFSGNLGVELFFALSGFLIGRILIGIVDTQPTWRNFRIFMIRRAMRTLPLYFLWLLFLLCVFPPRHHAVAIALRFVTLTQNLIAPMPPEYYYAVTWSLTIEEWFYLLFGGSLVLSAMIFRGRRALWICIAVFLIVPLALRLACFKWDNNWFEMSTQVFFRIDEIAYGVLMARLYLDRSWLYRHPWLPLGIGLTLIGLTWTGDLPVPQSMALALTYNATVIGCALCLPAALRLRRAPAWFERPVRWVSGRSYALYIVHWTVLVDIVQGKLWWPGNRVPALPCAIIAIVLPFILAEISYRFLEGPILRHRPRQEPSGSRMTGSP